MIAGQLFLLAATIMILAPRFLVRSGWVYRAPRLGIAAWYAVLVAVIVSASAAIACSIAPWAEVQIPICLAWQWCAAAARGGFGVLGQVAVGTIGLVGIVIFSRLALSFVILRREWISQRAEYRNLLRLTAGRPSILGATVIDCSEPAAFMVAGDRRVVVTTGALGVLNRRELAAVVAHERAHVAGRHDLLLAGARMLDKAFPAVALFGVARRQIARLVEMRADEVAALRHDPLNLARALVALTSGVASPVAPASAVKASGGDAAERLERLLRPPARLSGFQRFLSSIAIAGVVLLPTALLFAEHLLPIADICLPDL